MSLGYVFHLVRYEVGHILRVVLNSGTHKLLILNILYILLKFFIRN